MSWWPEHWTFPGVEIFIFLSPWLPEGWAFLGASILVFIAVTAVGIFFTLKARNTEAQRLGREILWATLAAYAAISIGDAYVSLRSSAQPTLWNFATNKIPVSVTWVFFVFLLMYWAIPLIILFRYKNDLHRRWHVWGVWVCTTVFLAWELLTHRKDGPLIVFFGFVSTPIITALSGLVVGEALFRLQNALGVSRLNLTASSATKVFVTSFLVFVLVSVALVSFERLNEPKPAPTTQSHYQPPNATVHIGRLPRVFPDSTIFACSDPSDTLLWVDIITGRLYEKELQDGNQRVLVPATPTEVSDGITAFHKDQRKCQSYTDKAPVVIEGTKITLRGVELLCLKSWVYPGTCDWALAAEIDPYQPESDQRTGLR